MSNGSAINSDLPWLGRSWRPWLVTLAVVLMFLYIDLVNAPVIGKPLLDARYGLDEASICHYLSTLSDVARTRYRSNELGADLIFPPLYALALALWWRRLSAGNGAARGSAWRRHGHWAAVPTVLADWSENVLIVQRLDALPDCIGATTPLVIANAVKSVLLVWMFAGVLVLLVLHVLAHRAARENAA